MMSLPLRPACLLIMQGSALGYAGDIEFIFATLTILTFLLMLKTDRLRVDESLKVGGGGMAWLVDMTCS